MFPSLQLEVMDRFTALEEHFRATRRFHGHPSQTAKGLVFVEIYAIHEYTVNNVVRAATAAIAAHSHAFIDLRPCLLALFLDPELQSLRDCPPKDLWKRRLALFDRANSVDAVSLASSPLPVDGTHFRHTHLDLILEVLGITQKLTLRRRHMFEIDKAVDNRNSISHGRETAQEVGRRYSREEIWLYIRRMKRISLRLIAIVSEHCTAPDRHRR